MSIEMEVNGGVFIAGQSYLLTVTDCVSIVDYIKQNTTQVGYHIVQQQKVHFNLLSGQNQPFQSYTAVLNSYADEGNSATRSNLSDIITDWEGNSIGTITLIDTTVTDTVNYDQKTAYTYNATNHLYARRIKQTYDATYLIQLAPSFDTRRKYYFATWTHITPYGETNEGLPAQADISNTLLTYYADLYLWVWGLSSEYWTLVGDYKRDPNFINPNVYFSYEESSLQTLFVWFINPGDITPLPSFPTTRPDDYDPDLVWVPTGWDDDTYTPPEWDNPDGNYVVAGGGRWGQNLVVCGDNKVYYEAIS